MRRERWVGSGDAVGRLVARFNREGPGATKIRHGGGPAKLYTGAQEERILREVRRSPDRETDGTATWSLTTLQRALRRAPDGLPTVSTQTIWCVLHDAGYSWQRDRSWCETGQAVRKRVSGQVKVNDPDSAPKKTDRDGLHPDRTAPVDRG
jgi:transposase